MDDKIKEVMGLVHSVMVGATASTLFAAQGKKDEAVNSAENISNALAAIESKLRELVQESERMRLSIENLKRVHESDEAGGGEMWYAEAILPAVEACIKELP